MSLQATYLQDLRTMYPSNLDRFENRITQTGLVQMALEMTDSPNSIVAGDLKEKARESEGRNLDIPVMNKGNVTIKNVRSCVIACDDSESAFVRVTWKTIVADVCMVPGQYRKNEIKYLQDFNKKIMEIVEKFLVTIEDDLDTALDANKSQVYSSTIVGDKYALAGGAIQVPVNDQDYFFNDIAAINYADDFYSMTTKVVASHAMMPVVELFMNQGKANAENKEFQFAGKEFRFSNRITNGAGKKSTAYFMPDGSIGLLTRIDGDARDGASATDGTQWFEDSLPGLPFTVGIQYKSKCSDQSALNANGLEHLKATKIEHWQISLDYAIVVPYNTDLATKASPIRKVEFVA